MNKSVSETDAEIDRELRNRLHEFGITRLADTTGLDRVGIPTHSCVKPGTADVIWVYSGKGLTPEQSRIGAIMECIERTSALWNPARFFLAPHPSRSEQGDFWIPERFTERLRPCESNKPLVWVEASDLQNGRKVYVPADLVFTGRRPTLNADRSFAVTTSNGLAAGFSREQAIEHALAEVVERDAVSCAELRSSHFGVSFLGTIARLIGSDDGRVAEAFCDDLDYAETLDQSNLPPSAAALYERYRAASLELVIKRIPNDLDIPVFGASVMESMGFDDILATAGYGAHLDPEIALTKCLLEVAQSRATDRQGAREDCFDEEKKRLSQAPNSHWLAIPGSRKTAFSELSWSPERKSVRVEEYLERLATRGLRDVAVVDFDAYPGIHVVRVLVPGIETWHATAGDSRLGPRMSALFFPAVA